MAGLDGGWVHLSDTYAMGGFHAIFGSVIWGAFLTLGFLIAKIRWTKRTGISSYLSSASLCGLMGFVGGCLCAFLSVVVINVDTLQMTMGWISGAQLDLLNRNEAYGSWLRLNDAMFETRMFWTYPITGAFTGLGVGLALHFNLTRIVDKGVSLPIPTKVRNRELRDWPVLQSMSFVLGAWQTHVFLCLTLVLSPLATIWPYDAYVHTTVTQSQDLCRLNTLFEFHLGAICRLELERSIGEGFVHYLGSLGLCVGFFANLPGVKKASRFAKGD